MGFYDEYLKYKDFDFDGFFEKVSDQDIEEILKKDEIDRFEFLALLSPTAKKHIEAMAQKANRISLKNFGRVVLLYTPIYISNYCSNRCIYCSYNIENEIGRRKLNMEEIEKEAVEIAKTGLRHILLLTGESQKHTPVEYIADAVRVLKKHFDAVSIEIYPMEQKDYETLVEAGVSGLTVYQEVYNEEIYEKIHLKGPKRNYMFRLDTPERACEAKMNFVNIGALLGLDDPKKETFFTGLHLDYLEKKYPDVELSVSTPRIRPHVGVFEDIHDVTDIDLVQSILAYRIFKHRAGITISTRERSGFRDKLVPLGITSFSAGVSTNVGGHTDDIEEVGDSQFEISDQRGVEEVKQAIKGLGYQPIMKNWMRL